MDFISHLTPHAMTSMQYYYEKSFLTKPFNDSIYLSFTKEAKKKCFLVDIFICLCYHSNSAEKCFIGSEYTCNNECRHGNPLASISTYCWHGNKIKFFFLSCIKGQKYHIVC